MKTILFLVLSISVIYSQGYICAVGGGSENYNDWSDEPYRWIVQKADSGKIVILSYSDATSWLPNYFMWLGADTAYNKTISSTAIANAQSTYNELITAKAIYLRGGDQYEYIRLWKGTKTEQAIKYVFEQGGVIAGTSAGAMVLGDIDFSAQSGSAYPLQSLQNPFNSTMRFETNFLRLVPDVLFDTHLMERGRHGRLIPMIYNIYHTMGRKILGIGIDDRTAVCISPNGIAEVFGSGSVAFFWIDSLTRISTFISGKYTIENLKLDLLTRYHKYDLVNKRVIYFPPSAKDVLTARPWRLPKTNIFLTGNDNIQAQIGTALIDYLNAVNSSHVVLITHPSFQSQSIITNFLSVNNFNYSVVQITQSSLQSQIEAAKISNGTCFVVAGDSLAVLSLLNQFGTPVADSFLLAINFSKPVLLLGNAGKITGEFYVDNVELENYASYRGKMTNNRGIELFGDFIFQPMLYENSNFYENRQSALFWGLMRNRKRIGIYLNGTDRITISSDGIFIKGNVITPYIIVDARNTTKVDSSTYRASGSVGPRQVVAMNEVRLSLTNYSEIKYQIISGGFNYLTDVKEKYIEPEKMSFELYQNYPNPFMTREGNSVTRIRFTVPKLNQTNVLTKGTKSGVFISIKVYDILGREVATLIEEEKDSGVYEVNFNGLNFPPGVYFYQLKAFDTSSGKEHIFSKTRKMILIK